MSGQNPLELSGAKIWDITEKLSQILSFITSLPETIKIHAGINYVSKQQSELLKWDFVHLVDTLKKVAGQVHILGPIPMYGRGIVCLSCLLRLHSWLSSKCVICNNYIESNLELTQ